MLMFNKCRPSRSCTREVVCEHCALLSICQCAVCVGVCVCWTLLSVPPGIVGILDLCLNERLRKHRLLLQHLPRAQPADLRCLCCRHFAFMLNSAAKAADTSVEMTVQTQLSKKKIHKWKYAILWQLPVYLSWSQWRSIQISSSLYWPQSCGFTGGLTVILLFFLFQGLKRLMTICQKHFETDPSKCVEYNAL